MGTDAAVTGAGGARPNRILQVTAPARVGGLERVVQALALGQHAAGHRVKVAMIVGADEVDHPFQVPLVEAGVDVAPIMVPRRRYHVERKMLREICRAYRPDIVHCHGTRANVVDGMLVRQLGLPAVATAHGFAGGDIKNRAYELLDRFLMHRFDAVISVSTPLAATLRRSGVHRDRLHVVPNAWRCIANPLPREAARTRLGLPDDAFVVGWVGRVTEYKALDTVIASLPHVADLDLRVAVLGDGPSLAPCQSRARAVAVDDRIAWQGEVQDAAAYFSAFDVFVLSSRTEYCPIVLFEAMAARIPIVATTVGGVPDVVSEREAHLIPKDDPEALATALRSVFDDRGGARERARLARERLDTEFSFERWIGRHDELYEDVLARRRGTGP